MESRVFITNTFGKQHGLRGAAKLVKERLSTPLIVAEVGVADGRNALAMLRELNIERLYLVDSYPNYIDGSFARNGKLQEAYYNAMFVNMQSFLSKVTMVTRDSLYASTLFKDSFFDFVYIDGFHSYVQCKKDMEAWWPKVKNGEILGGHDIGHIEFPGVAKAVEQFSKKAGKEFRVVEGSDWVIDKL